jgi:hypothetical protein
LTQPSQVLWAGAAAAVAAVPSPRQKWQIWLAPLPVHVQFDPQFAFAVAPVAVV